MKHGQGTFYYPDGSKYEGITKLLDTIHHHCVCVCVLGIFPNVLYSAVKVGVFDLATETKLLALLCICSSRVMG